MHASTPTSSATFDLLRIAGGHSHALALARGAELFCASGTLLLHTSPVDGLEGTPSLHLRLHTGQSWCAPNPLWVQATALHAPVQLHYRVAPTQTGSRPQPYTIVWWQRLRAGMQSVWPRRLLR